MEDMGVVEARGGGGLDGLEALDDLEILENLEILEGAMPLDKLGVIGSHIVAAEIVIMAEADDGG